MIKFISTPTPDLVQGSVNGSSGPYQSGAVYWDGNAQKYKVIDANGGAQDMYEMSVQVEAGHKLKEMISWYERKKAEEAQIETLLKDYPNLAEAKKEFDVLYNILKDRNNERNNPV